MVRRMTGQAACQVKVMSAFISPISRRWLSMIPSASLRTRGSVICAAHSSVSRFAPALDRRTGSEVVDHIAHPSAARQSECWHGGVRACVLPFGDGVPIRGVITGVIKAGIGSARPQTRSAPLTDGLASATLRPHTRKIILPVGNARQLPPQHRVEKVWRVQPDGSSEPLHEWSAGAR